MRGLRFASLLLATTLICTARLEAQLGVHPIISVSHAATEDEADHTNLNGPALGFELAYGNDRVVVGTSAVWRGDSSVDVDNGSKQFSVHGGFDLADHLTVLGFYGWQHDDGSERRNQYGPGVRWHQAEFSEMFGDAWIELRANFIEGIAGPVFEIRFSP